MNFARRPITASRFDGPYTELPGYGKIPPNVADDEARDRRFEAIEAGFGERAEIQLDGDPVHEFAQWVTARDRYIFHGSNNREITEFVPVRASLEMYDHGERGNLGAVYGTQYGLWSLFFAVVDRERIRGSIRNGVSHFQALDGRTIDTYQFSVDADSLAEGPFTSGALYILPRGTFRQLPFWPDGPLSDEWASETAVLPLAVLDVEPDDFPFEVDGHDDGPVHRLMDLTAELIGHAGEAHRTEGGFAIDLAWSDEVRAVYDEWSEVFPTFFPTVDVELTGDGAARRWTLLGPEAFQMAFGSRLEGLLDD